MMVWILVLLMAHLPTVNCILLAHSSQNEAWPQGTIAVLGGFSSILLYQFSFYLYSFPGAYFWGCPELHRNSHFKLPNVSSGCWWFESWSCRWRTFQPSAASSWHTPRKTRRYEVSCGHVVTYLYGRHQPIENKEVSVLMLPSLISILITVHPTPSDEHSRTNDEKRLEEFWAVGNLSRLRETKSCMHSNGLRSLWPWSRDRPTFPWRHGREWLHSAILTLPFPPNLWSSRTFAGDFRSQLERTLYIIVTLHLNTGPSWLCQRK